MDTPIVVFADDFSGAAEIAGIGYGFGLKVQLQLELDPDADADLIVYCTNTRELSEKGAIDKLSRDVEQVCKSEHEFLIFKKIDSALRGHVLPEAEVFSDSLSFQRVFFLPANPSHKRIVREGIYYINDTKLAESKFRLDPVFPAKHSTVVKILENRVEFVNELEKLPDKGLITLDITSSADIHRVISRMDFRSDLLVGAGDTFRTFLEVLGFKERNNKVNWVPHDYSLIVNGSTIQKEYSGQKVYRDFQIGPLITDLLYKDGFKKIFVDSVRSHMIERSCVQLLVGEIAYKKSAPDMHKVIEQILSSITSEVIEETDFSIDLYLTGGSTAYAVIQKLRITSFIVEGELSPGVVVLSSGQKPYRLITKPGSYHWPEYLRQLQTVD